MHHSVVTAWEFSLYLLRATTAHQKSRDLPRSLGSLRDRDRLVHQNNQGHPDRDDTDSETFYSGTRTAIGQRQFRHTPRFENILREDKSGLILLREVVKIGGTRLLETVVGVPLATRDVTNQRQDFAKTIRRLDPRFQQAKPRLTCDLVRRVFLEATRSRGFARIVLRMQI